MVRKLFRAMVQQGQMIAREDFYVVMYGKLYVRFFNAAEGYWDTTRRIQEASKFFELDSARHARDNVLTRIQDCTAETPVRRRRYRGKTFRIQHFTIETIEEVPALP